MVRFGQVITVLAVLGLFTVAHADETKVSNPKAGTCKHTAQMVFKAAQKKNFSEFLKWVHPDFKSNQRMKTSWKRYSWKQLKKRVVAICQGSDCSYTMTRLQTTGPYRKVFVKKSYKKSYPCPMTCKKHKENWRLVRIGCI